MASTALNTLIAQWDLDPMRQSRGYDAAQKHKPLSFQSILEGMEYAEKQWLGTYLPTQSGPHPSEFFDRLLLWMKNAGLDDEDASVLFEFASQLLFFSADDFQALYRNAYTGPITRWIASQIAMRIDAPYWQEELVLQRDSRTWYCPVTDSMDIASFYHLNQLAGIPHRPGFRSLNRFHADGKALTEYMTESGLDRLVLLEDFVGTGSQTAGVVRWAVESLGKSVLFVPLIIAPDGLRRLKQLESALGSAKLQVSPIVELEPSDFISPATDEAAPLFSAIRALADRLHSSVRGTTPDDLKKSPHSSLGFKRPGDSYVGATLVMHSNCPNNTIPLVHHHGPATQWRPLFPRVEREPSSP